ncbi:MAG: glucan biosynthesis protein G [Candidatus Omnitrophica bacterium]|nr:glucan biosynthesis protein G [Candidatus Omnitrophota bacterium]
MISLSIHKKPLVFFCIALLLWSMTCQAAPLKPTRFKDVVEKAQKLAEKPFIETKNKIPDALKKIGYDQWRDIRFDPKKSLWLNTPFNIQFFHFGGLYQQPVSINTVNKNSTTNIPFSPDFFDYSQSAHNGLQMNDLDFAGFRIHYPLNSPEYADELISFLGASYFRALGKNLSYGLSARGLAIDIAELTGEEFPYFHEFWIIKPASKAKELSFYGLMESPSLTGAYSFNVRPGEETLIKVRSVIFFRKKVKKLGLAPLTSMFFYGENEKSKIGIDFRPEVHDSDGLLIQGTNSEWTWHPLINPRSLLINSFGGGQPLGFGLIQRDMSFDHYQDLEARYDNRPSVWITPKSEWGPGHIELLQIPTENEFNDNIGAYWVIDHSFEPGEAFEFAYTMSWHAGNRKRSALAAVESTRIVSKPENVMFIIDFLPDQTQEEFLIKDISPEITILNNYMIKNSQLLENTVTRGWRLIIEVTLDQESMINKMLSKNNPTVELRAFLKKDNTPISETWSYTYQP